MVYATHSFIQKGYFRDMIFWYLKNISSVVQWFSGGLE